jgi:hypothetical protein
MSVATWYPDVAAALAEDAGLLYVAPNGDDNNSGRSPGRPMRNIQTALDRLRADSNGGRLQLLWDDTLVGNLPTWVIDYQIALPEACTIRGEGRGKRLRLADGVNATMIVLDNVSNEFCGVEDIWISGNKANQSGTSHGIFFDQTAGSGFQFNDSLHVLRNVLVDNFLTDGIFMGTLCRDFYITACQTRSCDGVGIRLLGTDGYCAGCTSGGSGLEGVILSGANNRTVGLKSFEAGQVTAANGDGYLISTVRSLIAFCEAQDNEQHGFNFSGSGRSEGVGLYSDSNGQGATGYGYRVNNCSSLHLQGVANDRQGTPTQANAIRFDGTNTFNVYDIVGRGNSSSGFIGTLADSNALRFSDAASANDYRLPQLEINGPLDHDGTTVGFYGVAPVVRAAHIANPSGGVVIDAESRAAINAILVVLENVGLTASV